VRIRVIPSLLIHKGGLIKSVQFKNYKYVGDPINAVKIFNEKEVDEIAVIDIDATRENRAPNFEAIAEIASEAFMPMAYGGGITTLDQIKKILFCGYEKVIVNKLLHTNINVITEAANSIGSQSVVASLDIKKTMFGGYKIYTDNGKNSINIKPEQFAKMVENAGAGEILINNIDADGTYKGFDVNIIQTIASVVNIPVIAMGGAGSVEDFAKAKNAGASAVAAGSMFIFQRPHQAVLISYPTQKELKEKLFNS
jgi:imidazole glycerol-phosphate synthase subunit HisF